MYGYYFFAALGIRSPLKRSEHDAVSVLVWHDVCVSCVYDIACVFSFMNVCGVACGWVWW